MSVRLTPEQLARIEQRRLEAQRQCDAQRPPPERNRLGQFATPAPLAAAMLRQARALMGERPLRFLDPAIGTGAFYGALLAAFPAAQIRAAAGFEIDAHYARPCRRLWSATALRIRTADFTAVPAPRADSARYDLLVCNPPYVRHHHLDRDEKSRLQRRSLASSDARVSGLAGLYVHFMLIAHAWMRADALAGWLIPGEFMDVNYGRALRDYLLRQVTLLRVHRFDPTAVQFDDALVSSAVVWLRKRAPERRHHVELSSGGTLQRPQNTMIVPAAALAGSYKWHALAPWRRPAASVASTLGDLFRIRRGIATGDNGFFIMTRAQARVREIPQRFLRPILPSPRFLQSAEVCADEQGDPRIEPSLWLLDCRWPPEHLRRTYPRFWGYLESVRGSVGQGYLCRRRSPWFLQEAREPAPFVCTYMACSRRSAVQRFVLNHSRALAGNSYLTLQPRAALARFIDANPAQARRVWRALLAIEAEELVAAGRVYGGGLYKLEPGELGRVAARAVAALI